MGVKISLGRFISTRRKQKFMTQEELANKMHVSKSAIANGKPMVEFQTGIICTGWRKLLVSPWIPCIRL